MPTIFWLWLGAAVIFLIVEISLPGLIFACFAVGAVGGGISSVFTDSYMIQLGVFAVLTVILVPLTRPLANRLTKPSPQAMNVDAMVGETGLVTVKIDPATGKGMVKVDGQDWRAVAAEVIAEGKRIRVEKVQGVRLHVTLVDNASDNNE